MSVLEMIVEDLKALPAQKLGEVADYIHRLRENGRDPADLSQGERRKVLRETFGSLPPEDADAMEKAINDGCEKIDAADW